MAREDAQALCDRLFQDFLAPLVLGGPLRPRKAVGGKAALAIGARVPADADALSRVTIARVRVARRAAPVDRFEPAPSAEEWALAAVLHDVVHATHPAYDAVLKRRGPGKILDVADQTLAAIANPSTVGAALSRHTWFSRMFDLARTDVHVKWWTGSQTFLGEDPPPRLLAWPEIRRVEQTRSPKPLMDLPISGGAADLSRFTLSIEAFLAKTPFTDLATIDRESPPFAWTEANLAMCATHTGRTIALRLLALSSPQRVDAALGRATRPLFLARAMRALGIAIDVLRERALATAAARLSVAGEPEPVSLASEHADAGFALAAGALAATTWIESGQAQLSAEARRALLSVLAPIASSSAAKEVRGLFPA